MLAGQEFATCSDDDFRAYIIGWTLVWSGIIPYTIIASKVSTMGSIELLREAIPLDHTTYSSAWRCFACRLERD